MSGGFERFIFNATRVVVLVAVFASWCGALLMVFLGVAHTVDAFAAVLGMEAGYSDDLPAREATVVHLIEALDRFLISVVLLYFGYGLYGLFVRPNLRPSALGLPDWLHVDSVGELKQTVAEVIIVVLFVLFLRVALETFHRDSPDTSLEGMAYFLLLPVAILLLALALKLAELHPKRDWKRDWRTPGDRDKDEEQN